MPKIVSLENRNLKIIIRKSFIKQQVEVQTKKFANITKIGGCVQKLHAYAWKLMMIFIAWTSKSFSYLFHYGVISIKLLELIAQSMTMYAMACY